MNVFLRIQGFVLGLVHTAAGIAALVMSIMALFDVLNTIFPLHYSKSMWIDCKTGRHEQINVKEYNQRMRIRDFCNVTESDKVMFYTENVWFDMQMGWLVFVYFTWTGLFHLMYVTAYWYKYSEIISAGEERFRLRWFEYAVSAAIMIFLIAYFLGFQNVYILLFISISTFFIVILPFVKDIPKMIYIHAAIGYTLIWGYLFATFFAENAHHLDMIPAFVYAILIGEFLL